MAEMQPGDAFSGHPINDDDRADLIALLKMRFGEVPADVMASIAAIEDFSQIDHLIIVAANAAGWDEFLAEVRQPGFRIVGQGFDPLSEVSRKADKRGGNDGQ
ncbi:MAG: hypothetical protein M0Z36_01195 [Thermaerobacter sp.]|nr:hypothetical protein [Thermaerobacter sp.]